MSRSTRGHHLYNLIDHESFLKLNVKFHDHKTSGSKKDFCIIFFLQKRHGSHLGHVTLNLYKAILEEEMFENNSHIHVYTPGTKA